MLKTCAIVPAAGRGIRMGGSKPKQYLEISGRPVLAHTLSVFSGVPFISDIFLITPENSLDEARQIVAEWFHPGDARLQTPSISIVAGGAERQNSVYNGLLKLPSDCEWVIVHDGVRPFLSADLITAVWEGAQETGAAIAAVPATDTVKRAVDGKVRETLSRDEIWLVQTPQVFRKDIILAAYKEAVKSGWNGTDDASFVERIGVPVVVVPGERSNLKVTTPEDLQWGEWFLGSSSGKGRI